MSTNETIMTDPQTGGKKAVKAERYSLIPVWPLAELARTYGYGEKQKYEKDNWRKGYDWGWSYDSLNRHINAFWSGQTHDPESGLHHLAHAAWHCFTLMFFTKHYKAGDTRWLEERPLTVQERLYDLINKDTTYATNPEECTHIWQWSKLSNAYQCATCFKIRVKP